MKLVQVEATVDGSVRLHRVLGGLFIVRMTLPDGAKAMDVGFSRNLASAMSEALAAFQEEFRVWCHTAPAASLVGYGVLLQQQLDMRHDREDDVDVQSNALLAVGRLPVVMGALAARGIHLDWRAAA
jgi:hypothetical protein